MVRGVVIPSSALEGKFATICTKRIVGFSTFKFDQHALTNKLLSSCPESIWLKHLLVKFNVKHDGKVTNPISQSFSS